MFPFLKKAHKKTTIAVFDIGSASVGGALIAFESGKKPKILWSTRESMVFQSDLNFGRFLSSMLETFEKVLESLQKSGTEHPDDYLCVFSSPWYASQTRVVKMKRDKEFNVSKKGIDELIKKEIENFKLSHIEKYTRVGEEEVEIMEIRTIQMKLNGYTTDNPYGMPAKSLEMSLYISMAPDRVLKSVKARIIKVFGDKNVTFGSFSLVAFSTIRDVFSHRKDFLFMDISGEVTDISLVKGDVLLETVSFPHGKNFLVRRVASGLNTVSEEAESLLTLYREGRSSDVVKGKIDKILIEARTQWLQFFREALGSLSNDLSLPNMIFFTSDVDVSSWFRECMRSGDLGDFTGMGEPFEVVFLDSETMENFSILSPQVPRDPFIMIEALFADRIIEERHITRAS